MTIRQRRLLYSSISVVFLVLGSVSLMYASGYRYSLLTHTITKIGAVYVKSYPSGADVRIDGIDTRKRTPARVLNVIPGNHRITVSREGFAQWEKTLDIQPGETSFIRDIVLFKKEPAQKILSAGGTRPIIAANKSLYIFLDGNNRIHLTNLDSENDYPIATGIDPESLLALAPSNQALIFTSSDGLYVLDLNTESATRMTSFKPELISRVLWDAENQFIVWILDSNGTLNRFDLISRQQTPYTTHVEDFVSIADTIITSEQDQNERYIRWYKAGATSPYAEQTLSSENTVRLMAAGSPDAVLATDKSNVWLLEANGSESKRFTGNFVDRSGNRLVIATEFEIHLFDISTGNDELLDRTSQAIQTIQWHPSGSYILRLQENQVSLLEIDGRDKRNVSRITKAAPTDIFIFNKKGDRLAVLSTSTNTLLEIQ